MLSSGHFENQAGKVGIVRSGCVLEEMVVFSNPIFSLYFSMLQEDSRQKLAASENNVRHLETQLCEEKLISCNRRKVSNT